MSRISLNCMLHYTILSPIPPLRDETHEAQTHHYEEAGNRRGDIHLDLSHFVGLEFWCAVVVDEADPTGELKTREQTCHSDAHHLLNDTER